MKTLKINPSRLRKLSFGFTIALPILSTILFTKLTVSLVAHNDDSLLGWVILTTLLALFSFLSLIPLTVYGNEGVANWIFNKIINRKFKKHNVKIDNIEDFLYYYKNWNFDYSKDNCVLDGYILRKISKNTYEITSDPVSVFNNAFKASLSLKPHEFKFLEYSDGRLMLIDS